MMGSQMEAVNTNTSNVTEGESLTGDDAAWALTCAFLILTMQTGFAMLECGCVSSKNMANIMIKNVCDVSIGGITYWMIGYGLTYGHPSTFFCGLGDFFFMEKNPIKMGSRYSHYFFQFSFASTATTIVSGAVAERMRLHAYMIFSFLNILVYCIPAAWCWNESGWLRKLHFFDFAGVCVVHLNGGTSAIVSALVLGPRLNRFEFPDRYSMSSPVTALTGMFMLMWAWLGFNCGSTFGVTGSKWKVSALVAVTTLNGGIGGGLLGLALSMIIKQGKINVDYIINSILGGLVSVTGVCAVTTPVEALVVGCAGGILAIGATNLLEKLRIDDPVGAIPVHFVAALWGTLAVGLFGQSSKGHQYLDGLSGLFHGGGFYLLGVNALGALMMMLWSGGLTFLILKIINAFVGIRMKEDEELLGADWVEHDIKRDRLSNKLEDVLRGVDDDTIGKVVERLLMEISDEPMKKKISQIYSIGGTFQNGTLEHVDTRETRLDQEDMDQVSPRRRQTAQNSSVVWNSPRSRSLTPPNSRKCRGGRDARNSEVDLNDRASIPNPRRKVSDMIRLVKRFEPVSMPRVMSVGPINLPNLPSR